MPPHELATEPTEIFTFNSNCHIPHCSPTISNRWRALRLLIMHHYKTYEVVLAASATALPTICISKVHGIQFKQHNKYAPRSLIISITIAMEKLQEIPMKMCWCRKLSHKTILFHVVITYENVFNVTTFLKFLFTFSNRIMNKKNHSTQSEGSTP